MEGARRRRGRREQRHRRIERCLAEFAQVRLLADDQFKNARLFKSFDDFEEMPIHSTMLIDKTGRVHWARHGGGPFTDYDFLAAQLERMNALAAKASSSTASSAPRQ